MTTTDLRPRGFSQGTEPLQRRRRKCHPKDIWNIPQGHQVFVTHAGLFGKHNLHPPETNGCPPKRYYFNIGNTSSNYIDVQVTAVRFSVVLCAVDIFFHHIKQCVDLGDCQAKCGGWKGEATWNINELRSLKLTASLPGSWMVGRPIYRVYVCFREGKIKKPKDSTRTMVSFPHSRYTSPMDVSGDLFSEHIPTIMFESGLVEFYRGLLVGGFCGSNESFRIVPTTTI